MVTGTRLSIALSDALEGLAKDLGASADQVAEMRSRCNSLIGDATRLGASQADRQSIRDSAWSTVEYFSAIVQLRTSALIAQVAHDGE